METKRAKRKTRKGTVISNKMDKTIVVSVERKYPHPVYKKVVRDKRKFKVHDSDNVANKGDLVEIMETRPISKDKRWCLTKVIRKVKTGLILQEMENNDQIKDTEKVEK